MPIHPRLDLPRWIKEFPLAAHRNTIPTGQVVGPESIAVIEQLRQQSGGHASMGPGVPTDVMIWSRGEPPHRAATKTGGLPFRPANHPWPTGREGQPSVFVGQICFADSRDLMFDRRGKPIDLPGDVLLLFAPEKSGIWDDDNEDATCLQHEWWPLDLPNLIAPDAVPKQPWTASHGGTVEVCHAHLHRTADFIEVPDDHPIRKSYDSGHLCVLEGGKIGGVPYYTHENDPRPGAFIAALGSINPVGAKFPLLNLPANPKGDTNLDGDHLVFGDCGSLYLFLDHTGLIRKKPVLRWAIKGY